MIASNDGVIFSFSYWIFPVVNDMDRQKFFFQNATMWDIKNMNTKYKCVVCGWPGLETKPTRPTIATKSAHAVVQNLV